MSVGSEILPVVAIAEAGSGLGEDTVIMTGWLEIASQTPTEQGGVPVVEQTISKLELTGASRFGLVSVTERPDEGPDFHSTGELRAQQPAALFPAESTLELFLDLSLPDTPFGPQDLHNDNAFVLKPASLVEGWPSLGTAYFEPPGDCDILVDEAGVESDLGICVSSFRIEVAPQLASYSVGRGASGEHPADILGIVPPDATVGVGQPPYVRITCEELGLTACEDLAEQDNIDALSFGVADALGSRSVDFSVAAVSSGLEGTDIREQSLCPPAKPGASPEPESDIFHSTLDGSNHQIFDGNGPVGACQSTFPLGLLESIAARDELDAFEAHDVSTLDANGDGVWDRAVFFSLDEDSPTLTEIGASAADILVAFGPNQAPAVFLTSDSLGMRPGDDMDALDFSSDSDAFAAFCVSLAPGSPTLTSLGAGPGDLLRPGRAPAVLTTRESLGLAADDDLDAASCSGVMADAGNGDASCDGETNSIDATLVLQQVADLIESVPCPDQADVNGSGITSVDATLILQFQAGLLEHLPV